jgi:hypothetical protein
MLNKYRQFIQGFSTIACPLHQLTCKDAIWKWMKMEQDAFDGLKRAITMALVLQIADHQLPFKIETNTSDFALGMILSQKHEDGLWHPVAYYSWTMTGPETQYPVHNKEMLAIIDTFEEWQHHLEGATHQIVVW